MTISSTLTTTAATIYAAILLQPEDDTLRTMFADSLDDAGDYARAEFVRVQVELASLEGVKCNDPERCYYANKCDHGCGMNKMSGLRSRASELLAAHGDGWRRGEECPECEGTCWRRGNTPATCDSFVPGSPCPKCHGTGYTSPLAMRSGAMPGMGIGHKVVWSRGLISCYHATHSEVFTGDGPSEWACDVARFAPIERVVITDARVWPSGGNDTYYVGNLGIFPKEYWSRLENLPSRAAAHNALAQVTAEWVRRAAFKEKR